MKKLEDIIFEKMETLFGFIIAKLIVPDMKFDKVTDIDQHRIDDFKENYGIQGIILDVDETLRNKTIEIPICNQQWIELMKKNFKVIIVSNGRCQKMQEYFKSIGVEYISLAMKPARMGFKKACKNLGLRPENIMVIGNSLYSDIHGGHKNKMLSALVDKVEEDER